LLSNEQFKFVLAKRLSAKDEILAVCARENGLDYPRLGISIGKSAGNAVIRNRIKRLVREAFRLNQQNIPDGFDYVVTVPFNRNKKDSEKPSVKTLKFDEIQASFLNLTAQIAVKRG
jgi:ribonuclease P protein component